MVVCFIFCPFCMLEIFLNLKKLKCENIFKKLRIKSSSLFSLNLLQYNPIQRTSPGLGRGKPAVIEMQSQIQGLPVLTGRAVTIIPYPFGLLFGTCHGGKQLQFFIWAKYKCNKERPMWRAFPGPHVWLSHLQMTVTSSLWLPRCH